MIKRFLLSVLLCAACAYGMAQGTTVTHIVQRGETIESIAEYYHVSVEAINKANPNMDGLIYVGMKIAVPADTSAKPSTDAVRDTPQPRQTTPVREGGAAAVSRSTDGDNGSVGSRQTDLDDFSFYGIGYRAIFEDAGKGRYGFSAMMLSSSGWGVNFFMGADYGLAKKHFEGVCFYIGPSYGHAFGNVLLTGSLDFVGAYVGQGEREQTGTNHKGETYTYMGTKSEFVWGVALTPQVGIKLGKAMPYLGLDFDWAKGSDGIDVGFFVGVGFNI